MYRDVFEKIIQGLAGWRTEYYLLLAYSAALVLGTLLWAVPVCMEATKRRKSRLLAKYGSRQEPGGKTNARFFVLSGMVLALAWIMFIYFL